MEIGFNVRGIIHYGYPQLLPNAPAADIDADLKEIQRMNGTIVRVFVGNNQVSWQECANRLDAFLTKAQSYGISVIPTFIDLYQSKYYPSGTDGFYDRATGSGNILDDFFFQQGYTDAYKSFVQTVVTTNKNHPNIYAWEIGNELKDELNTANFVAFMQNVSATIKSLDPNHPVATGMLSAAHTGMLPQDLYSQLPQVDIITVHAYDGDRQGVPDVAWAVANGKTAILEEVGFTGTGDRSASMKNELAFWEGNGAKAALQWGLVAKGLSDNGDGDSTFGMDTIWHTDYAALAAIFNSFFPDLVVNSVSFSPSNPNVGDAMTFTSVVQNQGGAATPSGVPIGVAYLIDSHEATWGSDPGPLAPGQTVTITTQGGPWTVSGGSHTLAAWVDDADRIVESNKNNNQLSVSFTVPLPDLVVDSVSMSPPAPTAGQSVSFSCVVRNAGAAATPAGAPVGVAYLMDGSQVTWGSVPGPLNAGASVTITTQGGPWTATAGTHQLTAWADDVNRIVENNESNNTRSVNITLASPSQAAANLFGMNIDPTNPAGNPSPAQLKGSGVNWVRMEWKSAQGFALYDPTIAAYRAAGIKVLLLVDYSSVPGDPGSTASAAAWTSYLMTFNTGLSQIAGHYKNGVDAWEIWNEPDVSSPGTGYDPGVPSQYYGTMLQNSANTLHAVSTQPILMGGLASGDANYVTQVQNASGGLWVDAIAVHPYGQRAPDNWPDANWGFGNMSDLFNRYLAFGLPVWVSEIGTQDASVMPDYLSNVYALAGGPFTGQVPVVFWFCWSDGMVSPFGILDAGGQPKTAYQRYKSISPTSDNTAPVISAAQAASLTPNSAVITWTTDKTSDSRVDYGPTVSYGSSAPIQSTLVTQHSVSLSSLSPATTYHFAVKSQDLVFNLGTSTDLTFTTPSTLPPQPKGLRMR